MTIEAVYKTYTERGQRYRTAFNDSSADAVVTNTRLFQHLSLTKSVFGREYTL